MAELNGSISTSHIQNFEGTILNWFDIFTFTCHSFLVDVYPYLITKLKLMKHLMIAMPCLVFGLALVLLDVPSETFE